MNVLDTGFRMIQDVCLVFWRFAILIYFSVGEVHDSRPLALSLGN